MKRKGNIYEKICTFENCKLAIIKASKNKKYRNDVNCIIHNIDRYAMQLSKILKNKIYEPSPYIEKKIYDGANKKERTIYKPKFYPDQCVHWALMLQIEDMLKKGMYDWSCAAIENRGVHYGARHIKKILVRDRKNTKYCLKLDIKKYYPSINKNLLKRKFRRIIKDNAVLELIEKIVDSSEEGLPIRKFYFTMVC